MVVRAQSRSGKSTSRKIHHAVTSQLGITFKIDKDSIFSICNWLPGTHGLLQIYYCRLWLISFPLQLPFSSSRKGSFKKTTYLSVYKNPMTSLQKKPIIQPCNKIEHLLNFSRDNWYKEDPVGQFCNATKVSLHLLSGCFIYTRVVYIIFSCRAIYLLFPWNLSPFP